VLTRGDAPGFGISALQAGRGGSFKNYGNWREMNQERD